MTYGQIAELLGHRLSARAVGWAMYACPDGVPWHRVVNAAGECSSDRVARSPGRQRALLEKEGVRFDRAGRLDLEKHRWKPRKLRT
jgi:methylated-DNA-protein-cysteine methyltransferase-like protein